MSHKWVMMKPGAVIRCIEFKNRDTRHTFTKDECNIRYHVVHSPTWNFGSPANNEPMPDWHVYYKGQSWFIENSKTAFTDIKIPAMKKEFVTLAVKGSEWEFKRDWTFNGWVTLFGTTNDVVHTIPVGTRVKIVDSKMRLAWHSPQEKCIVAELAPGLEMFAATSYLNGRDIEGAFIPAKEASGYLKLVTAGKAKTYWKIEDTAGNAFVDKRFANLGNVKSSLRVRYGLVKEADDATVDDYIPDWVQYDGFEKPDREKGIWAVHYDHATNKELAREDMVSYVFLAALKA